MSVRDAESLYEISVRREREDESICRQSASQWDVASQSDSACVRQFDSGATRSNEDRRIDPEGFLSPQVLVRYAEYMNKHRVQPNGEIRESDNWQKGIPVDSYMKSAWRHFLHLWLRHRNCVVEDACACDNIEEDLCALMFNIQGYLFEILNQRKAR